LVFKKFDFDPDPEREPEKPEKSGQDPEIIFSDPTHCLGEWGVYHLAAGEAGSGVAPLTQVVQRVVTAVLALHHRLHVLYVVPAPNKHELCKYTIIHVVILVLTSSMRFLLAILKLASYVSITSSMC